MIYPYVYFVGSLVLGLVWVGIFLLRKDLRKEIQYGSLLALPFGFTEFLFVPQYWDPPSLFNLIHRVGFGIESFLFAFFVGGISATLFELLEKQKLVKKKNAHRAYLSPYLLVVVVFAVLEILLPAKSIYNLSVAFLVGALLSGTMRSDLCVQIGVSGLLFGTLYTTLFVVLLHLFPNFVQHLYTVQNLSGYMLWGVPLEEILFAFSVGACWSTLYEYLNSYRTKPLTR